MKKLVTSILFVVLAHSFALAAETGKTDAQIKADLKAKVGENASDAKNFLPCPKTPPTEDIQGKSASAKLSNGNIAQEGNSLSTKEAYERYCGQGGN